MTKQDIKTLESALKVLKKEFKEIECKEVAAGCAQCWADLTIKLLEGTIWILK